MVTIAGIVNAGLIFFTFLLSLPAMILPDNRRWLKIHGWLVVVCALFTLVLGLDIWFHTLKTRAYLNVIWDDQSPEIQSMLQRSVCSTYTYPPIHIIGKRANSAMIIQFDCCGYLNSTFPPFQVDETCPTPLIAAQKQGCVGPFSDHANSYLDLIFTADFGIVGELIYPCARGNRGLMTVPAIDVVLLLCVAIVLKDRKEQHRYRLIDAKNGVGRI